MRLGGHRWPADNDLAALDQPPLTEPAQRMERSRSRRPRAGSPTRITVAALRSAVVCSASTPRDVAARGTRAAPSRQRRSSTPVGRGRVSVHDVQTWLNEQERVALAEPSARGIDFRPPS